MCLLLETIKLENGKLVNIEFHNERFNKSRKNLFALSPRNLEDLIEIPKNYQTGIYRCRVVYGQQLESVEFIQHQPRKINSLQIIVDNSISYNYKFVDRSDLQKLYEKRGDADEIIIIKNGLVTDCFIGNLVFFDGKKWLTPNQPLLQGTQRQKLLAAGKIQETKITEKDLPNYSEAGIINVFYDLNNMPRIKKGAIKRA